jgi:hypothetical protein
VELAKRYPQLNATALELPRSPGLEGCLDNIRKNRLENRIAALGMDVFDGSFPDGTDLVQFIHVVNMFSPERNRNLIKEAWSALKNGGKILIVGPMSDEDSSGITSSELALYSPLFLVCKTGEGQIYPSNEITGWLKEAGFSRITVKPM